MHRSTYLLACDEWAREGTACEDSVTSETIRGNDLVDNVELSHWANSGERGAADTQEDQGPAKATERHVELQLAE